MEVRYKECYEEIVKDDILSLTQYPKEKGKDSKQQKIIEFIGDIKLLRVSDIGCGDGEFLNKLECKEKYGLGHLRTLD